MENGKPNPRFVLNHLRYKDATILLTRNNFGCGSSREYAPWALKDYGFRVIIAPTFADIFFNNCFKNDMLPIVLPESIVEELFQKVLSNEGYHLTVNLQSQTLRDDDGWAVSFEIDPFKKKCLLEGLDDIALTLQQEDKIRAYEEHMARALR